jgi:preprotein translocase subunit SecF
MLIQKKISNKKLAIYIFLIFSMLGGAIFFIQKNRNLTKKNLEFTVIETEEGFDFEDESGIESEIESGSETEVNQSAERLKELNKNKIMDLEVLENKKFKDLKIDLPDFFDFKKGNKDLFITGL